MNKVFMIAYQYPPMGGPGVQRTLKFTKYLKDFDWEPVVFTRDSAGFICDDTLIQDIPENMYIIRGKAYDFEDLTGILKKPGKFLSRKILIPDGAAVWKCMNRPAAFKYVSEQKPDIIYSTSYPYSDHLLALGLKKKYPKIPWVADFRDEWMNNPYLLDKPYNTLRMRIESKMERETISNADAVIANTPVMMKNFIRSYGEFEYKFSCIPNGFDKDDFNEYKVSADKACNEKMTFTYTGMLYGRRKPDLFLDCIRTLIDTGIIDKDKIKVKFIGKFTPGYFNGLCERFNLQDIISVSDYLPHKESIKQLLMSDVLLLIEGAGPGGEAFYTGKLFEYMNAKKPIVAIIPEKGVAADLIKQSGTGYVADCDNREQILHLLTNIYKLWYNNSLVYEPDYSVINKFERKNLTKQLVDIFNNCMEVLNENS